MLYSHLIFQTVNSVKSKFQMSSQRFTPSGCKDIEIRKFEFVANTQILCSEKITISPLTKSRDVVLSNYDLTFNIGPPFNKIINKINDLSYNKIKDLSFNKNQ